MREILDKSKTVMLFGITKLGGKCLANKYFTEACNSDS